MANTLLIQGCLVIASTSGASMTYPDPLEIARAYGLTPHRSAASLEPVEVIDPCPLYPGCPRVQRGYYFSVSPMWPNADEINFAEQCYQTACRLFVRSEGKNHTLIEGALKYARMGQYYGHLFSCDMIEEYYQYKKLSISIKSIGYKTIVFPEEPDERLALIARRTLSGGGGGNAC